jgi:hypothetical protein
MLRRGTAPATEIKKCKLKIMIAQSLNGYCYETCLVVVVGVPISSRISIHCAGMIPHSVEHRRVPNNDASKPPSTESPREMAPPYLPMLPLKGQGGP